MTPYELGKNAYVIGKDYRFHMLLNYDDTAAEYEFRDGWNAAEEEFKAGFDDFREECPWENDDEICKATAELCDYKNCAIWRLKK